MDVLPMCSIFQELQIVHDTGYFSALPSLEEYWQQVILLFVLNITNVKLPIKLQLGAAASNMRCFGWLSPVTAWSNDTRMQLCAGRDGLIYFTAM